MKYRSQGFTLLELLIAVAIIGIIAAIALPSYQNIIQKTRRSDAIIALSEAAARQEQFFAANNSYAGSGDLDALVTNSDGQSSPEGYYVLSVDNSACTGGPPFTCYSITATAVGSQADDTQCATFTINQIGQKTGTSASCW
jgi:type IV pilus assembly protein PilE